MTKDKISIEKVKVIKKMLDDKVINNYKTIVVDTYTTNVPLLDSMKNVIPHYASTNSDNITAKDLLLYVRKLIRDLEIEKRLNSEDKKKPSSSK